MMKWDTIENVYLIGIGGIGMSALARYFKSHGKNVAGYDRTPTTLTGELAKEGMIIHHDDKPELITSTYRNPANTLVIYTPAVAEDHSELVFFRKNGFQVMKRAEVLGEITKEKKAIAVSGTHGKTTTTSMIAHVLTQSEFGCNAFLGGILKNYNSNLLLSAKSPFVVVEADEYDRSFLKLSPTITIVTSIDAEHLDIYGTHEAMIDTYREFLEKIQAGGTLIYKKDAKVPIHSLKGINIYSYSSVSQNADFYISNLRVNNGKYTYDFHTPKSMMKDITVGLPGLMNVENSVAAMSASYLLNVPETVMREAIGSFMGARRRFDYQVHTDKLVYIDDYAHHPEELKACILSARNIFKDKKITGIFQPHLYTRTRDFADAFAESLDLLDEIYLLDIYPAREKPIEGVTSDIIFSKIKNKNKTLCSMHKLMEYIEDGEFEVLITMGAGNIDKITQSIKNIFEERNKSKNTSSFL